MRVDTALQMKWLRAVARPAVPRRDLLGCDSPSGKIALQFLFLFIFCFFKIWMI